MTIGSIIGFIVFGLFALNLRSYIQFMNLDFEIYKEFALYSVIQLYIQFLFFLVLEKLYFEGKEKKANKYCIQQNLLNFAVLILSAIFIKNKIGIVIITLVTNYATKHFESLNLQK